MMSRLRQLPLLALLFLAGSPGLGGVALQAVHACKAELGAAAASPAGDAGHHGGHHDEAPEGEDCRCIGACHTSFYAAPPQAAVVSQIELPPPADRSAPRLPVVSPAGRGHHLLPPATAPPLG